VICQGGTGTKVNNEGEGWECPGDDGLGEGQRGG
jgi:hypothetical protein